MSGRAQIWATPNWSVPLKLDVRGYVLDVPLFRPLEFDFGIYGKVSAFNLISTCCPWHKCTHTRGWSYVSQKYEQIQRQAPRKENIEMDGIVNEEVRIVNNSDGLSRKPMSTSPNADTLEVHQ